MTDTSGHDRLGTPRRSSRGPSLEQLVTLRLKLRHLRLIIALDDHRKLNRAAQEMGLSQPAASKMLGEIEKTVGVPLFERRPRGIEPTRYGEALVRRTRAMLAELGHAGEEIEALRSETGGAASVGALMAPAAEFLAEAVTVARRRLARLQVSVDVDTSDVLIGRLLAAKLDFAIARIPEGVDPAPFEFEEIGRESVELLVRRDHPLAALPVVTPADLADREWVLPPRGSLVRRSIEQMMRRHGLPPVDRVLNSGSILMSLVMARRADSIAPLAAPVADLFTGSGDLVRLPLAETPSIEPYGLIRVIGRPMSPAARILYDVVRGREYAVPAGTGATVRTGGTVQASARS